MATATNAIIDLVSLIEQNAPTRLTKAAIHRTDGPEYWGTCPFCGTGENRFHVWPEALKPHWWCRICNKTGDHIDILTHFRNMTYVQACEELGIEIGSTISHESTLFHDETPPPAKWQEMANLVVKSAENYLWAKAPHALDYLYMRGFTEETIRRARLGYVPLMPDGKWYQRSFSDWGLTDEMLSEKQKAKGSVKIPPGILIPWFADGALWKLAIKRFETKEGEMKYGQVVGSKDALYGSDSLARGKPALLVEGEFDAMSASQEVRDIISPIATGSTSKARIPLWIARLASLASFTLVGFDAGDKNGAGDNASAYWLETLPKSMRWLPFSHDTNDMLQEGKSIRQWVELGLSIAMETPTEQPLQGVEAEPFVCSVCGLDLINADVRAFISPDDTDIAYCEPCWEKLQAPEPPPATTWYTCSTCGRDTMRHEPDGLCSWCHWDTRPLYVPPPPKPALQNTWR